MSGCQSQPLTKRILILYTLCKRVHNPKKLLWNICERAYTSIDPVALDVKQGN